jgi:hypothetical protein
MQYTKELCLLIYLDAEALEGNGMLLLHLLQLVGSLVQVRK